MGVYFQKLTYCVKNSIHAPSKSLITVMSLLDTSVALILIQKDSQLIACKEAVNSIRAPQLRTKSQDVFNIDGFAPLLLRMGDLRVWV